MSYPFAELALTLFMALSPPPAAPVQFSPADGGGTAIVEPSGEFPAGTRGTWRITYTAGPKGISKGGGIVLLVSPFWGWTEPQAHSAPSPGYVTAEVLKGDAVIEILDAGDYAVLARVARGRLAPGDKILITYGDTAGGKHPDAAARIDRYAERKAALHLKVDGDGDGYFREIEGSPTIDIVSGPPAKLAVFATSVVPKGEKGDLSLAALDRMNNRVRNYGGRIILSSVPRGLDLPASIIIAGKDRGSKRASFSCATPGVYRIEARDEKGGLGGLSNPIEVVPAEPELNLYWADPHGHSNFSDGTGLPEDYYLYALDVAKLDICALTDHDAWGVRPLDENPRMWEEIVRTTNGLYRAGRFVTFIGYEWTNWEYGHMHVLFKGNSGALLSSRSDRYDNPDKLWAALPKGEAITIPHHPGGGPMRTDWRFYNPSFEPVAEICSVHGVSEHFGGPLAIYHPVEGAFIQDALAKGYMLGFVGGGDSHNGHPGIPYADAPVFGLTGVYARGLTREAVWEAITARRTYATTGERIILRFRINGAWMGEEINASQPLTIFAEAVPCAPVSEFALLHNGKVIHSAKSARMNYRYEGKVAAGDYFYVRLTQENSHMAFSSPIWMARDR